MLTKRTEIQKKKKKPSHLRVVNSNEIRVKGSRNKYPRCQANRPQSSEKVGMGLLLRDYTTENVQKR